MPRRPNTSTLSHRSPLPQVDVSTGVAALLAGAAADVAEAAPALNRTAANLAAAPGGPLEACGPSVFTWALAALFLAVSVALILRPLIGGGVRAADGTFARTGDFECTHCNITCSKFYRGRVEQQQCGRGRAAIAHDWEPVPATAKQKKAKELRRCRNYVSLVARPEVALYRARSGGAPPHRVVRVDLHRLRLRRLVDLRTDTLASAAGLGPEARRCTDGDGELLYAGPVPPGAVAQPHPSMARCEALAVGAPARPGPEAKHAFLARLPAATTRELQQWGAEEAPASAPGVPKYPWGWDPPGARRRMVLKGREARVDVWDEDGRRYHFGARTWRTLGQYLSELEWPPANAPGGQLGITFAELAIDYEVSTGHDLPPTLGCLVQAGYLSDKLKPKKGRSDLVGATYVAAHAAERVIASQDFTVTAQRRTAGADVDAPWEEGMGLRRALYERGVAAGRTPPGLVHRPLRERAMCFADAIRRMAAILKCDVVPVPNSKWLDTGGRTNSTHGGEICELCKALWPLDGRYYGHAGLPRRPILRGGAKTEQVLRGLAKTASTRRQQMERLERLQREHGDRRTAGAPVHVRSKQQWSMWYADYEPEYDEEFREQRAAATLASLPPYPPEPNSRGNGRLEEELAELKGEDPTWKKEMKEQGHDPVRKGENIVCARKGCACAVAYAHRNSVANAAKLRQRRCEKAPQAVAAPPAAAKEAAGRKAVAPPVGAGPAAGSDELPPCKWCECWQTITAATHPRDKCAVRSTQRKAVYAAVAIAVATLGRKALLPQAAAAAAPAVPAKRQRGKPREAPQAAAPPVAAKEATGRKAVAPAGAGHPAAAAVAAAEKGGDAQPAGGSRCAGLYRVLALRALRRAPRRARLPGGAAAAARPGPPPKAIKQESTDGQPPA
eukprot:gene20697-12484_t